jgi:hypothetical protein
MKVEPKLNSVAYEMLLEIYEFMCDGRIGIARERLEEFLQIQSEEN